VSDPDIFGYLRTSGDKHMLCVECVLLLVGSRMPLVGVAAGGGSVWEAAIE